MPKTAILNPADTNVTTVLYRIPDFDIRRLAESGYAVCSSENPGRFNERSSTERKAII